MAENKRNSLLLFFTITILLLSEPRLFCQEKSGSSDSLISDTFILTVFEPQNTSLHRLKDTSNCLVIIFEGFFSDSLLVYLDTDSLIYSRQIETSRSTGRVSEVIQLSFQDIARQVITFYLFEEKAFINFSFDEFNEYEIAYVHRLPDKTWIIEFSHYEKKYY